jgi:hypothetical protein
MYGEPLNPGAIVAMTWISNICFYLCVPLVALAILDKYEHEFLWVSVAGLAFMWINFEGGYVAKTGDFSVILTQFLFLLGCSIPIGIHYVIMRLLRVRRPYHGF